VGLRAKGAAIVPKSGRPLLFAGQRSTSIPAGAVLVSDEVDLRVPAQTDLAIDLYFPGATESSSSPITLHNRSYRTNYVSHAGNHVGVEELPVATTTPIWHWLARVEVSADAEAYAVVALGDSITDGNGSDMDTNTRWPDELGRRLQANPRTRHAGVINAGIGGNRLLSEAGGGFGINALARFDRDVLAQPNVAFIIVLEGINDIGMGRQDAGPSVASLIAAHLQLIARAHAHGVRIVGATLTPFEGANYWSAEREATRQALNEWIRTSGAYDAVIDFDAATRDPKQPTRFLPQYHAGDWLHPNSAGYKAMAAGVDLRIFERRKR
jgi:lysophospholipase L1-like esterase